MHLLFPFGAFDIFACWSVWAEVHSCRLKPKGSEGSNHSKILRIIAEKQGAEVWRAELCWIVLNRSSPVGKYQPCGFLMMMMMMMMMNTIGDDRWWQSMMIDNCMLLGFGLNVVICYQAVMEHVPQIFPMVIIHGWNVHPLFFFGGVPSGTCSMPHGFHSGTLFELRWFLGWFCYSYVIIVIKHEQVSWYHHSAVAFKLCQSYSLWFFIVRCS